MTLERRIEAAREWMRDERFDGIERLYGPRDVAEQQGSIPVEYPIARDAARQFHGLLRECFRSGRAITTFGPYSPGQAVTMKRLGIEAIYLGGWATSARGDAHEDPGADLASYPLSRVPDEAAPVVRALLAADRNQQFERARMSPEQRAETPEVDYRPFIVADADTGHGGDAHVRNLVRRFVEAGVCGYHIEDQKPGVKKCGHQGGKVLVSTDEQIRRLNAARFQLDVMRVAGIVVARTDAEAATFLDNAIDGRDQPFILGATNVRIPAYRAVYAVAVEMLHDAGLEDARGYRLVALGPRERERAREWIDRAGLRGYVERCAAGVHDGTFACMDRAIDALHERLLELWQAQAGLMTYGEAVAEVMAFREAEGETFGISSAHWREFARDATLADARDRAAELGVHVIWDMDLPRTPEGYYPVRHGIEAAIARSLSVAPYADVLWMETKTARLDDARRFAEAIHSRFPDKMLAYNLSPSFNWDTTGMTDDEMRAFPTELGRLGYVFDFITYGGHQIDGLAAEEFATALRDDGMLALARLQRRLRLLESPYRTPQALVGGPRLDGALMASTGRMATTRAMGKGSTHQQHLVQTEPPPSLLAQWLGIWCNHYGFEEKLRVSLRPHTAGSDLLELAVSNGGGVTVANIVFTPIRDRRGDVFLSVRDQNTFVEHYRKKRLMTLAILYLVHRYDAHAVHFVAPTEDNRHQAGRMRHHGLFAEVSSEIGDIIVARVDPGRVAELLADDRVALGRLIDKTGPPPS